MEDGIKLSFTGKCLRLHILLCGISCLGKENPLKSMFRNKVLSLVGSLCVLAAPAVVFGQSTPLAATPPMGWNSWNHFAGKVTDADVRATADVLVSSGMRDAGYIYVNIDDT